MVERARHKRSIHTNHKSAWFENFRSYLSVLCFVNCLEKMALHLYHVSQTRMDEAFDVLMVMHMRNRPRSRTFSDSIEQEAQPPPSVL